MEPVSGLSSIIEILRRQIGDRPTRLEKKGHPSSTTQSSSAQKSSGRADTQQLERQIINQIRALDLKDKNHQARAIQIFIGSVLAWEFGDEIVQDDRFPELLEEVYRMMTNEPQIKMKLDQLIDKLNIQ